MWDTSEYISAAYVLGIPHPPGNPLFVLIGRVFAILPLGHAQRRDEDQHAGRAHQRGRRGHVVPRHRARARLAGSPSGGSASSAARSPRSIGATAFTVWNQSVVNEKVYTVSLMGLAIISWLTVRWCDDPDGPTADRLLVLIAYLLGLGYANHMMGLSRRAGGGGGGAGAPARTRCSGGS